MNLTITKIVRKGKFRSRVETSDGKQLVVEHRPGVPFVGQELDINMVEVAVGELRPLRSGDPYPEIIDALDD